MSDKAALRRLIRSRFGGEAARAQESEAICRHILQSPWYLQAQTVGAYMPLAREADVQRILEDVLQSGRTLALPLCGKAPHMTLRRVRTLAELVPGAYGIPEPGEDTEIIPVEQLDLLIVPLEGVGPDGMRLGKGGGYYDCQLAGQTIRTMGAALSWQRVGDVPAQPWDRPLMALADRDGVTYFNQQ